MISALLLFGGLLAVSSPGAEPPSDLTAYESASRGVGRDADAHVRLALWCEAHGLRVERIKHLALAVLYDPKNATARGLLGLVAYGGQWKRPETVADKVKADEALTARLAEYNNRRARMSDTADGHWALGLWCEQNDLGAEAQAHFTAVTRLDPSREAAWKRLGCKKVGGRWITEGQLAVEREEADAQKKANAHWKPLLTKWRGRLADRSRRDEAEQALVAITDPRAVPAVWSVFVAGSPAYHNKAVQLLGQIDAPGSSRALAFLAVFDNSAEVRRTATETLRRRDPREFAGLLVGLLRKPLKYEVRPVGGPGSPGALFVEGQRFNIQRLYAPPAMPVIPVAPNDRIDYDINGLPVITRTQESTTSYEGPVPLEVLSLSQFAHFNPTDPALASAVSEFRQNADAEWAHFFQHAPRNNMVLHHNPAAEARNLGVMIGQNGTTTTTNVAQTQIAVGQMMVEYQQAALGAQQQLARDLAQVEAFQDEVKQSNARVTQVLGNIAGQDRGEDPESWRAWWIDIKGYAYTPAPEAPRPTLVENVPLAYMPDSVPATTTTYATSRVTAGGPPTVSPYSSMPSCFGAGTLVRTLEGTRTIESIRVGDRALTQDIKTGALGYHPVTVIHHNPPSPTFLVKVGGDTIVSSPFHRFWIAGKGWVMARDLKGGEVLRLLDGPARVESVENGPVQPVFNLDVAEAHDFFAGAAAALVHDNTLPETRIDPFDATPELTVITSGH